MAVSFSPASITMYTGDTGPTDRFQLIEDGSGLPIDLTGATAQFLVRRLGATANVWSGGLTNCTLLPNPQRLLVAVTPAVDVNGNYVSTARTVRVTGTTGFGVGNVLRVDGGTPQEEDVTITALDANHITGAFLLPHVVNTPFDLLPLFTIPTVAATVTLSGTAQSVLVSSSAGIAVGNSIRVGTGTANDETLTVTAIVDGTHLSGIFAHNHAIGEQIQFAVPTADPLYNARNGYLLYTWPSGGLLAGAQYVGQLKITFPDGTTEHSDELSILVKQGL